MGRVKSRQGVPGSYVHQTHAPIRGNSKIRPHRKVFPCGPSSTTCSNLCSACNLLLPLLVLSGLLSVCRRSRTPPREWGERDEMVYRGILKVLRCLPRMECASNGFSAPWRQSHRPPERDLLRKPLFSIFRELLSGSIADLCADRLPRAAYGREGTMAVLRWIAWGDQPCLYRRG